MSFLSDGGDCIPYNMEYPLCNAEFPFKVGDLECDVDYLTMECKFDNNDCCKSFIDGLGGDEFDSTRIGNGICEDLPGERYNTKGIIEKEGSQTNSKSYILSNSYLIAFFTFPFDFEECGYDNGDCIVPGYAECRVRDPTLIGNHICNEEYNIESCGL